MISLAKEKQKGSISYKRYENEKHKRLAGPAAVDYFNFYWCGLIQPKS